MSAWVLCGQALQHYGLQAGFAALQQRCKHGACCLCIRCSTFLSEVYYYVCLFVRFASTCLCNVGHGPASHGVKHDVTHGVRVLRQWTAVNSHKKRNAMTTLACKGWGVTFGFQLGNASDGAHKQQAHSTIILRPGLEIRP